MRASLRTELLDRAYLPADRSALLDLEPGAGEAAWNAGQLAYFLEQERAVFRVIVRRRDVATPIAFYAIQHHDDALFIANLMVERQWRRQGIGSFALDRIVRIARKLDCERVFADVQESNLGAQIICREHQFLATEICPRHFASQDGYRMERRLDRDDESLPLEASDEAAQQRQSGKRIVP